LADIEDVNSANVNVLTHLEKPRVEYLVQQQGMSFSAAKQQAQCEVLAIFGFEPYETTSEALDLTVDAKLLAISCLLQGKLSASEMMEFMANINTDIKQDGILDNIALGTKLMNNAYAIQLSLSKIRDNLTNKYAEFGNNVIIPDFESYIRSFINSNMYPLTLFITYPERGETGFLNVLSDNVTEVTADVPGLHYEYSMTAIVPKGQGVKIVLKDGLWYAGGSWYETVYDETNKIQEFTTIEDQDANTGVICFFNGTFDEDNKEYITVECYENGATTPTKTKRLYMKRPSWD
jgi:hypothetical protein